MDVVLEVCDTFLFDRLYAALLPAFPHATAASLKAQAGVNATFAQLQQASTFVYEPATPLLVLEPSIFAYMSQWNRDNLYRQALSLFAITWFFGIVLYFTVATASYFFVFDKETFKHPKYLKNQMPMEMRQSLEAFPAIAFCTVPFFMLEVRGYSKMYNSTADGPGLWYDILSIPFFIFFTDLFIYWIHRGLHHPRIYKHLHKAHHKWVVPTPFASHAFHPLDGFAQGVPYHVFPFLFPLSKVAYIGLFVFVNLWTVMIHDGEYATNNVVVNGAACHTMHHLYFNYNYGQFTTLWDRVGGSYRKPNDELFRRDAKMSNAEWQRQCREAEEMIKDVEGKDDRVFLHDAKVQEKQKKLL